MIIQTASGEAVFAQTYGEPYGPGEMTGDAGAVQVGDKLVCPNGHELADVVSVPAIGEENWHHMFRFTAAPKPAVGTLRERCTCPKCGEIWLWPAVGASGYERSNRHS